MPRDSDSTIPASNDVTLTDSLEERLATAVAAQSAAVVAERARSLLDGGYEGEGFLLVVGGTHAEGIVGGAPALYWPELWGARALLYVWDDSATPSVLKGLGNPAWRVREMCARVAAARGVGEPAALSRLTTDRHARVRAAGARALGARGDATSESVLTGMLRDSDKEVRRAAQQALSALVAGHPGTTPDASSV